MSDPEPVSAPIDPGTEMGSVTLTVADLDYQAAFYREAIGLEVLARRDDTVELCAAGSAEPLVVLVARPEAPPRPPRTTGLFHLALLVASRADLARALRRVVASGNRLTGASDHLVSEALYLDDPEGNGIELYCDRPRQEWSYDQGELKMATLPLDVQSLLAADEDGASSDDGMAPGTRIGHVHLQVADIPAAAGFYVGTFGFEPTARSYPGALFVSAGGYHHHLGLNTWAGNAAPAPPEGALGLRHFEIVLPDAAALGRVEASLAAARIESHGDDNSTIVADPSGNRALLTTR